MAAAIYNIEIEQGALYDRTFLWEDQDGVPIDMTGWTGLMQIRPNVESSIVLFELSTENDCIFLNYESLGQVRIVIPTADSNEFSWKKGVYDLELYDADSECFRFLKGKVIVDPQVTRVVV